MNNEELIASLNRHIDKRFAQWAVSYLSSSCGIDPQTVDIQAFYDSCLTYSENKEIIKREFPCSNLEQLAKLEASELQLDILNQKQNEKYVEHVTEETKKVIETIRQSKETNFIHTFNETLKTLISNVALGYNNALFVVSEQAGIGKSTLIFQTMNDLKYEVNNDYAYVSGYSTPLSLYELLFEHKDKKLIILDDLDIAFRDPKVLSILKNATWSANNQRTCEYRTTSKSKKAPEQFIINARLILISNSLPETLGVRTLLSRSLYYKIELTHQAKMALLADFVKIEYKSLTIEQRQSVYAFLESSNPQILKELSFRTMLKIYELVLQMPKPEEWQKVAIEILDVDEEMSAFIECLKEATTASQIEKFEQLTGLGRRSFFRIKKRYWQSLINEKEE